MLRELIRRIEADVEDLSDEDQARIAAAITVIRKTRQVVNLGSAWPGWAAGRSSGSAR